MSYKIIALLVGLLGNIALGLGFTHDLLADDLKGASLAATCAQCHGTQGQVEPTTKFPKLAGMDKDYFLARMKEFRDSQTKPENVTIMHQIAKGFSDDQIGTLATYFASQK